MVDNVLPYLFAQGEERGFFNLMVMTDLVQENHFLVGVMVNLIFLLSIVKISMVYIRDEQFDPGQFYALGRPCKVFCNEDKENSIHSQQKTRDIKNEADSNNIKCSKNHHWIHKKTIADVVEALVGAFVVDCGFKAAIAFLKWIGMQVDFEASKFSKICTASKIYLEIPEQIDIKSLENLLGYSFLHKGLLVQAFVHPSYNKHSGGCYQRLEFLGDAVLDYLITSYLYSVYPKLKPGQLTDLRSASVNNVSFATVAVARCFHKYLISDSGNLSEAVKKFVIFSQMDPSRKCSVESPTCPKALGDVVESTIGAILLDSGFNLNVVWGIMISFLHSIMSFSNLRLNPVRQLQELCQACNWDLKFEDSKRGVFLVDAHVIGESIHLSSNATNLSKKAAMRKAAEELFLKLKAQGHTGKSKTLEQILKSTEKEEAKLIGFDKTPLEAVPLQDASSETAVLIEPAQLEELNMQENSSAVNNHTPKAKTMIASEESPYVPLENQKDGMKLVTIAVPALTHKLEVFHMSDQQSRVCLIYVLATIGILLYLNVSKSTDLPTRSCSLSR